MRRKTTELFIIDAYCKHGDRYNYKLVSYTTNKNKVKIICPVHGMFKQRPDHHINGSKCPICNSEYSKNNIPLYKTFHLQLEPYGVKCRRSSQDTNILEVKCMYCDKWYQPTLRGVWSKISSIKGQRRGESNFYCSNGCKVSCPTYNQTKYPKGFKNDTSREVQSELRKLVLERDSYQCVRCGKGCDEVQLHCHHLTGVELNPIESADIDNCIILCKEHHLDAHKDKGCRYSDLRKKKC